jgi:mono/diheme cytochrome c family protein
MYCGFTMSLLRTCALLAAAALLAVTSVATLSARADARQAASSAGSAAAPAKTVWDGSYTDAQATRGEAVYAVECSSCHAEDLSGQQSRLIGERFLRDWREDNLGNLFRRIKGTMPRQAAGSLSDAKYLDLVAYILQQNAFPAGSSELDADAAGSILLVGKEGPQPVPEFALIQLSGCLTQDAGGGWILTNATDPRRTRTPDLTPEDLKASASAATVPGTGTYRLMDAFAYHPDAHKGHSTGVKGLLIRRPENRINVTALDTIASSCAP